MTKLFKFLRPYRLFVVLVLVLTFLQTLSTLYLPNLMSDIVDHGVITGRIPYIVHVGVIMLAVTVLGSVTSVAASLLASQTSSGFGQILRQKLFSHVERFGLHEFDQIGTSSLIVRTTNDVMQVQQLINMMLRMMIMAPLTSIGGIIMATYTDVHLAWVFFFLLPILALAVWGVLGKGLQLFRLIQQKVDRLNRVLREYLTGTRVIRAFDRTDYELHRFDQSNLDLTQTSVTVFQRMAALGPMAMGILNLSTIVIVWFGGHAIASGILPIGKLMAFIQYVMQIMFSVMMVSMMSFMIPRGQASAVRISEVLDLAPEILDPKQPQEPSADTRGTLEFRDVTFRYPGAEEPCVSNLSFTVHPGEITAIIGGTGAGKSTLLNLIPRFYDVSEGSIFVDGLDIRSMTQAKLRQRIGYVPQRAMLFSGSVFDNIRVGREQASDEEVRHAADVAQATDFILQLNQGFDAFIVQGGANLSGGQKQRLAIARALVRKAEIYLFDDSFSALDYKTDAALRQALRPEIAHTAVVIVAQRVSTVMDADRILVMDQGRIVASGTHRDLLQDSVVYREIVASQLSEGEIA